jgi:hypothetical protein
MKLVGERWSDLKREVFLGKMISLVYLKGIEG